MLLEIDQAHDRSLKQWLIITRIFGIWKFHNFKRLESLFSLSFDGFSYKNLRESIFGDSFWSPHEISCSLIIFHKKYSMANKGKKVALGPSWDAQGSRKQTKYRNASSYSLFRNAKSKNYYQNFSQRTFVKEKFVESEVMKTTQYGSKSKRWVGCHSSKCKETFRKMQWWYFIQVSMGRTMMTFLSFP